MSIRKQIADIRIGFWNHNQWKKVYKAIGNRRADKILALVKEMVKEKREEYGEGDNPLELADEILKRLEE